LEKKKIAVDIEEAEKAKKLALLAE